MSSGLSCVCELRSSAAAPPRGCKRQIQIHRNGHSACPTGILALWLRGMPFSITAAVGFIAILRPVGCASVFVP